MAAHPSASSAGGRAPVESVGVLGGQVEHAHHPLLHVHGRCRHGAGAAGVQRTPVGKVGAPAGRAGVGNRWAGAQVRAQLARWPASSSRPLPRPRCSTLRVAPPPPTPQPAPARCGSLLRVGACDHGVLLHVGSKVCRCAADRVGGLQQRRTWWWSWVGGWTVGGGGGGRHMRSRFRSTRGVEWGWQRAARAQPRAPRWHTPCNNPPLHCRLQPHLWLHRCASLFSNSIHAAVPPVQPARGCPVQYALHLHNGEAGKRA